jgi:arylsulfatase
MTPTHRPQPYARRERFVRGLVLAVVLLTAVDAVARCARATTQTDRERPNVLFVLTDDQGYGDLSCHGNPVLQTPHLDRLYSESLRFTDFHVAPMCTPTRSELMTGQNALRNGAYCACSGRTFLRRDLSTMPEIFAAGGYRTGMFGKWHLGDNVPHRPRDRGFQRAVYHLGWGITSTPDYWNNDYFDDFFRDDGALKQFPGYCTDVWFREAAQWIRACCERGEPFFAYLSLNAPHGPFFAPAKYKEPYKHLDRDTAGFFAMIANIDENMARLDEMLRETGVRDNTLLIFMTDNGGTGGIKVYNAGLRGAKSSLYDGGHRVPCFFRWPAGRLRPPGDVDALAHSTDILPTLIELCRLERPQAARLDGLSLAGVLRGAAQSELDERMAVVQYGGLDPTQPQPWDAAVLWKKWRLVKGDELYDVGDDPGQQRDLADEHPDIVAAMRRYYQSWWDGLQPTLKEFETITLGSDQENPTRLSSLDWLAPKLVVAAQPFDVRQLGVPVTEGSLPLGRPLPLLNGPWNVELAVDGRYEITLRRWPKEADAAVTAPLPAYQGVDGAFPPGKALPAARARLKIGEVDVAKAVEPSDKAAVFTVPLRAGKASLQTWFYDDRGRELCGAFYVEVRRTGPEE